MPCFYYLHLCFSHWIRRSLRMKNYFFLIWGTTVRNTSPYRQSRIFFTIFIKKTSNREKNNTRSIWRAATWIWSLSFPNLLHQISIHFKAMTHLDSILKSRDITLLTKVHIVKALVFPVVMYGCESWIINNFLNDKKLMLSSWGAGEDSWESLGQQGDPTSQC